MLTVIDHTGREIKVPVEPGETLARAVFSDWYVSPRPLCSGLGRCAMCRVRFEGSAPEPVDAERLRLTDKELEQGWRMSCRHRAENGITVHLPPPLSGPNRWYSPHAKNAAITGVAVDLGTTSVQWEAYAGKTVVARGSELNPQIGIGSEVMSRLAYATGWSGSDRLRSLVRERLAEIMAGLNAGDAELCVAGNPAMIYLLLGRDVSGLSRAPYFLDWNGGEEMLLAVDLPPVYVPPLIAPFVGADISAGMAHLLWSGQGFAYPFMLADMGTNGEFILAVDKDTWLGASVPLGPALEGIGLTFGCAAEPGAITAFALTPQGLSPRFVEDFGECPGVTGTGYLSLAQSLLAVGIMEPDGGFVEQKQASSISPLAARLARQLTTAWGEQRFVFKGEVWSDQAMYLTGDDVEALLKVKAAFNVAFTKLLSRAGLTQNDLTAVYLAGAMGRHVSVRDLEELGFIPPGMGLRVHQVGNLSLAGAGFLLRHPELREELAKTAAKVKVLDLASEYGFGRSYVRNMVFTFTG
ncbi:MAG: DUF4445 domain-containing protein [Desulfovibrio sp.]|nr:MAG: DUF4445 domain-containing protein [Desulfovibrio sp.]